MALATCSHQSTNTELLVPCLQSMQVSLPKAKNNMTLAKVHSQAVTSDEPSLCPACRASRPPC